MKKEVLDTVVKGDIISKRYKGKVTRFVVTARTNSGTHFWVRDLKWGDDGWYDVNHDLTRSAWFAVEHTKLKWGDCTGWYDLDQDLTRFNEEATKETA